MEPQFNTSFIPKKSLQEDVGGTTPGKYVNRRSVHGPGFFLTMLIFIVTVLAAVGVFAYTKMIQQRIADKVLQLDRDRAAFKPEVIHSLKRVDQRLSSAHRIVQGHVALTSLLNTIEDLTLTSLRYTTMSITAPVTVQGQQTPMQMTLTGSAKDFRSVALQADSFKTNQHIEAPVVTSLQKTSQGDVTFTMQSTVSPELVRYTASRDAGIRGQGSLDALSGTTTSSTTATTSPTIPNGSTTPLSTES